MAKLPPGVLHRTLQTEPSTEAVTSGCRMALMDRWTLLPGGGPVMCCSTWGRAGRRCYVDTGGRPSSTSRPMGWKALCWDGGVWKIHLLWQVLIELPCIGEAQRIR